MATLRTTMSQGNNALRDLYNFTPAWDSLFEVTVSGSSSRASSLSTLATLQATGIKLPSETLNLERDRTTFKYKLRKEGSYQRVNSVSITWREDENFSVRKLHEEWLQGIYDPTKDAYIAGSNPYMDFTIIAYKGDGSVGKTIVLKNVIPQKWGDLDFKWGEEPHGVTYTITYYVEEIQKTPQTLPTLQTGYTLKAPEVQVTTSTNPAIYEALFGDSKPQSKSTPGFTTFEQQPTGRVVKASDLSTTARMVGNGKIIIGEDPLLPKRN